MEWRPITTAPRDGTPIEVFAEGIASAVMHWNPKLVSPITETPGCWVEIDGPYTWSEGDDYGPTHWRPAIH